MKKALWISLVLLSYGLSTGRARADLITYTFGGSVTSTSLTGVVSAPATVTGTFSYDIATQAAVNSTGGPGITWQFNNSTQKVHTNGSLTWNFGGQTYTAAYVTILATQVLTEIEAVSSSGAEITLQPGPFSFAGNSSAPALPGNLAFNLIGASVGLGYVNIATPGGTGPIGTITSASSTGGITSLDPEPSCLLLAAIGACGLMAGSLRRQG
jgi:hypothetical protein